MINCLESDYLKELELDYVGRFRFKRLVFRASFKNIWELNLFLSIIIRYMDI